MAWEPPTEITMDDLVRCSDEVMGLPDRPFSVGEDIFRIRCLGMNWDFGLKVYEPQGASPARGADGKPVGVFMIHGGAGDYRRFDRIAPVLTGKFGYKVVCFTFPGRLYFPDPSRNWPGDTLYVDGSVRTPIWERGMEITKDQYDVVKIVPELKKRRKRGTLFFAAAKEGTPFYDRMAAWPAAFEDGMKESCRRHFPENVFSIYVHGHSTGGPFAHYLSQRVANIVGIIGMETSPFGSIYAKMVAEAMDYPFNHLVVRTWRDYARYKGPEAGSDAAHKLPMLMEEVFEAWDYAKTYPQFKAEYMIHFADLKALRAAAEASARRVGMNTEETEDLVQRYQSYTRPLKGPGVKPIPPIIYGITQNSVDHKRDRYAEVVLPSYRDLAHPPKVRVVHYDAGAHDYTVPQDRLPCGIGGATAKVWNDAIHNGYYLEPAAPWT